MILFSTIVLFGTFMKIDYFKDRPVNMYYYIMSTLLLLSATLAAEVCFTSCYYAICPDHIANSFWNTGIFEM